MEAQATNELDLVFCCDCTGSMSSYIQVAKDNITKIIEKIQASEKRDVQFAVIGYRDHPPQDSTFVTQLYPFTKSVSKAKSYVSELSASGGGDTPEAVAAALRAALNLPYRKSATKVVVIVADAPPHGLTSKVSDGFPNGSPDGADPIADAIVMAERGIVIYAVGCEPTLSGAAFARHFFKCIANLTGGRYIALGNSLILPDVIIGGAEEEIALEKLAKQMEEEKQSVEAEAKKNSETLSDEMVTKRVWSNMISKGVTTPQLNVAAIPVGGNNSDEEEEKLIYQMVELTTLAKVKELLDSKSPSTSFGGQHLPTFGPPSTGYHLSTPIPTLSTSTFACSAGAMPYSSIPTFAVASPSSSSPMGSAPAPSTMPYSSIPTFTVASPSSSSPMGSAPAPSAMPYASSAYAAQTSSLETSPINYEQVARCMTRNSKRK